ncbi:MAG: AAA family ATPase [Niabella sp.]
MQLRQSSRSQAKIKMCLQGSSGSGKTLSSLLIAYGLVGDWTKVVIIDTENKSADLYSSIGNYNVVSMEPPYTPKRYCEAIDLCLANNQQVIIIDSISHCWEYLLDYHSSMAGNSFTNWAKINPLQRQFTDKLLQSNVHVIATMRSKQEYVLNQRDGKFVPEKVGLKGVFRDGIEYDFTIVFDINSKHNAIASKDRTQLFVNNPESKITIETGKKILNWCNSGKVTSNTSMTNTNLSEQLAFKIENCKSMPELVTLYQSQSSQEKEHYANIFNQKKRQLLASSPNQSLHIISQHLKTYTNGINNNHTSADFK